MESSQIYIRKTSNVIPVFKRGENQDYNNYQPISLISNLSKLMEKLVHPRLYRYPEKNYLPFEQQYGFSKKLSSDHALTDTTRKIQTACDKGSFACGVYVDFKKAFDTDVSSKILIPQMQYWCPNSGTPPPPKKKKSLLELKMTGKCLIKSHPQQLGSIKFTNFWPLSPHHRRRLNETTDFRYKWYPPKISGYITDYGIRGNKLQWFKTYLREWQ